MKSRDPALDFIIPKFTEGVTPVLSVGHNNTTLANLVDVFEFY